MEDIDKDIVFNNAISDDDESMMNAVVDGDVDLYYLNHYLSEILRKGDNF